VLDVVVLRRDDELRDLVEVVVEANEDERDVDKFDVLV